MLTEQQDEHRGRLQAQGSDMSSDISRAWAQGEPKLAQEARDDLDEIKSSCTKRQRNSRERGFVEAKKYIDDREKEGGLSPDIYPASESFPRSFRYRKNNDQRVDIEVWAGVAFI